MDSLSPVSFSYIGVSSSSEEVSATEASTFSSAARAIFAEETNPNTRVMLTHRTNEILVMVFLQHPPDWESLAGQRWFLLGLSSNGKSCPPRASGNRNPQLAARNHKNR